MGTKSSAATLKLLLNVRPRKASSMEARAATSSVAADHDGAVDRGRTGGAPLDPRRRLDHLPRLEAHAGVEIVLGTDQPDDLDLDGRPCDGRVGTGRPEIGVGEELQLHAVADVDAIAIPEELVDDRFVVGVVVGEPTGQHERAPADGLETRVAHHGHEDRLVAHLDGPGHHGRSTGDPYSLANGGKAPQLRELIDRVVGEAELGEVVGRRVDHAGPAEGDAQRRQVGGVEEAGQRIGAAAGRGPRADRQPSDQPGDEREGDRRHDVVAEQPPCAQAHRIHPSTVRQPAHRGHRTTAREWCGWHPPRRTATLLVLAPRDLTQWTPMGTGTTITVFLADDSVIIREGVRAMLAARGRPRGRRRRRGPRRADRRAPTRPRRR